MSRCCAFVVVVCFSVCLAHSTQLAKELQLQQHGNNSCCTLISDYFGPKTSYRTDAAYNESLTSYWSEQEQDVRPSCVLRPTSDLDVSLAVKILSAKAQCKFAIRGGGHFGWPGSANIEDDVTIDLTSLDSVIVSPDHIVTTIGGGAHWNQVYSYLDSMDLNVAGGRYATVGVGGLTLGGGISFFSPRYGFVADTVESFDLVMADGKLETISANNNPDLFRALKGGSNNFGIVTAIRLKTFPGGPFFAGTVSYNRTHATPLAKAFKKLAATPKTEFDPYCAFLQQHIWTKTPEDGISTYINNLLVNTKAFPPDNSTAEFLQPLQNAAPAFRSDLGVQYLAPFLEKFLYDNQDIPRRVLANLSFRVIDGKSDSFMEQFLAIMTEAINTLLSKLPYLQMTVTFQPIHPIFTSKAAGENVLGFSKQSQPNLINAVVRSGWAGAENDELMINTIREAITRGKELAKEMGVDSDWLYLNYSEKWQDPILGYGVEEMEFLRNVSRKYDPKGVFQRQVPGGFKLWDW